MKVLIIEDELPASERLIKLINEVEPGIEILETIVSVKSAIKWFENNPEPDLAFFDIQLSDGISFEIMQQHTIKCPVIFTTAFSQYAIEAFKMNSIDYLLKPLKKEPLKAALEKYKTIFGEGKTKAIDYKQLIQALKQEEKSYQKRIVIRYGDNIKTVEVNDVYYFYTENKINFLCSKTSQNYPVDYNLDELERILDPKIFFRINRQFIVNVNAIQKMVVVSKSRVKLTLQPPTQLDTIVSTERSSVFKEWLAGA